MRCIALVAVGLLVPVLSLGACGGGDASKEAPRGLQLTVHESTAARFRASVAFGPPALTAREEAGEIFTLVDLEGCRPGGANDGEPGVPVLTRILAVPQGARLVVSDVKPVVSERRLLLLYPYQVLEGEYSPAFEQPVPIPLEEEDWAPPFAYDRAAYAGSTLYPSDPVEVSIPSVARDLSVAVLQIAAGQYDPGRRLLTLFSSVEFTITFEGGTGLFLRDAAGNPFEEGSRTAVASTWNHAAVEVLTAFESPPLLPYGEELLILTHPAYREAADRLADHKRDHGLLTTVITVNDGPGTGGPDTKEEIKAFLDDRFAASLVRFSYLLLVGDAGDIPPWMLPRRYATGDFPSDFPYAQIDTDPMADDLIPEIAVGRVAVGSLAEANVVVDKIIQYETDPPFVLPGGPFYGRAAIASYFQPGEDGHPAYQENKRRFIQDSEEVRGYLTNNGFDVQRIYTATHPLTEENTPRYYRDGTTLLPAPLRPEDAYPWDGDTQQIIGAFNAYKSLFFHVDHGGPSGWGHPHFVTTDLASLVNGEFLPLVLSDNCSSGAFDYASAGFAESILRLSGGGAIGVIAFTRNSNNGVGRQFLIGVVDALFPSAYPAYGDDDERHRLGDMLNHARGRMTVNYTSADPASDSYLVAWCYARMLTLFGDPTLKVWMENPTTLPVLGEGLVAGPAIDLVYPYGGATITVLEQRVDDLVPIGRGVAADDGAVHIDPVVDVTDVNGLRFFASAPGAVSTPISVAAAGSP